MGNICSCANGDDVQQAAGSGNAAAAQRVGSAKAIAQPKVSTAQDVIDQSLADARHDLEKNKGVDVHDFYKVSKLVGHGAFAKVMICTHKVTQEKFAVKTVQKNLEDPQKQREGALLALASYAVVNAWCTSVCQSQQPPLTCHAACNSMQLNAMTMLTHAVMR